MAKSAEQHVPHQVIKPTKGWQVVDLKELWRYKDLLYFLVYRAIKAKYAQSVLGVGWAVLQPLVTTGVFTIVFGNMAQMGSDNVPYAIFSFAALVNWTYFSNTLNEASGSLVQNKTVLSKVYFPRLVLPLSTAVAKLLDYCISFLVFGFLLFLYGITPTIWALLAPLFLLMLILTAMGVGNLLAAMAVQYRDIKYAMNFVVQMLMYTAPVVYPVSKVPESWQFYYGLNPLVGVIEGFRAAFLQTKPMPWEFILTGLIVSVLIFFVGSFYFKRMEKNFADIA